MPFNARVRVARLTAVHGRGRVLAKEEDELVDHVVDIGATMGLLGCARADALFEMWTPFNRDAREVAHGCDARRGCLRRSISLTSLIHYEPLETRLVRVLGIHMRRNSESVCARSARVVFASCTCNVHSPTTSNHHIRVVSAQCDTTRILSFYVISCGGSWRSRGLQCSFWACI